MANKVLDSFTKVDETTGYTEEWSLVEVSPNIIRTTLFNVTESIWEIRKVVPGHSDENRTAGYTNKKDADHYWNSVKPK